MSKSFMYHYEVCSCNHVSLAEIVFAIKSKNAYSIEKIGNFTDAGKTCRCCISKKNDINIAKKDLYISDILERFSE